MTFSKPYRKPGGGTPHPRTHEIIHMREAALYAWTYCISTFSICKPYLTPAFTGKPHVHMNKHDIRHDCDLQSYCCLKFIIPTSIWMDLRVSAQNITKAGQNVWWDQSPSDHFSLLHKHTVEVYTVALQFPLTGTNGPGSNSPMWNMCHFGFMWNV